MHRITSLFLCIIAGYIIGLFIGLCFFHLPITYISKYPNGQLDTTTVYLR